MGTVPPHSSGRMDCGTAFHSWGRFDESVSAASYRHNLTGDEAFKKSYFGGF
jgi:hypothetical protein